MDHCLPAEPALHVAGATLFACLMLAAVAPPALAHGDAAWIMNEPGYVTGSGSHCCGPTDCERAPDGEVVETAPGQWYVRSTHQTFRQEEKGVYPSKQGSFWWCRRGARVVCLFYDAGGF
jgi:hypothetical protein